MNKYFIIFSTSAALLACGGLLPLAGCGDQVLPGNSPDASGTADIEKGLDQSPQDAGVIDAGKTGPEGGVIPDYGVAPDEEVPDARAAADGQEAPDVSAQDSSPIADAGKPDAPIQAQDAGAGDAGQAPDLGQTKDAGIEDRGADSGQDASEPLDSGPEDASGADAGAIDVTRPDAGKSDAGVPDAGSACPSGMTCVTKFPFSENRDTTKEPAGKLNAYSCKPSANESGPEIVYRVLATEAGFLSAVVYEESGVDVDVHILSSLSAQDCLSRGDVDAHADILPGEYYVVIDTYVASGKAQAGPFRVDIGFYVPSRGPCEMQSGEMARVGDGGSHLKMPATGPLVLEAHLVTQEEPPPYPSTATEKLAEHYQLSQDKTGFVMHRNEVWAPLEGGSFYGAGIGDPKNFPVLDESWYVNMYWTSSARPKSGSRMIIRLPNSDHAVVVAAGYETGPGDLSMIGGTPEESHYFLGTQHGSTVTLGLAQDQGLPFGPRICE